LFALQDRTSEIDVRDCSSKPMTKLDAATISDR
jgi:hypothetical protein